MSEGEIAPLDLDRSNVDLCLNCSAPLAGQYCSSCGQRAGVRIISIWTLLSEVASSLFNMDSRIWRSLIPLVFRPGYLTVAYLQGRRMYYVPPFRLYLLLSLAFFLLNSININQQVTVNNENVSAVEHAERDSQSDNQVLDAEEDTSCAEIAAEISGPRLRQFVGQERIASICETMRQEPRVFLERLIENLPSMMFVFLPLIACFMSLLYMLSCKYFVEHLLFVVHCHALAFLLLSLVDVLKLLAGWQAVLTPLAEAADTTISLYLFGYLFLALRHVYGKRWLKLRYLLLLLAYAICLLITLLLTLTYTALAL